MGGRGPSAVRCSTQKKSGLSGQTRSIVNDCRSKPVCRYGRNGKANVLAAAAVLVLAAVLFALLRPQYAETPADPARVMQSDAGVLTKLAISDSGDALAAASADGEVLVWRLPGRRLNMTGKATESPATMLNWSPDGLLLCGDRSGLLRSWQQPELKESLIDSPRVAVTACDFRQELTEKQLLLGLSDGRIVTIDPSGTTLRDSGHRGIKAMLISKDQKTLVSAGSEGDIIWYDFKQDRIVSTASDHETEIAALNWSPDGKQILSADWNGELRLWDAKKRQLVGRAWQSDAVSALQWTRDRIVTGSWDGRIRVWKVKSEQLSISFSIYTGQPIHDLVVESSGETAFTVSGAGSVREWSLSKPAVSE